MDDEEILDRIVALADEGDTDQLLETTVAAVDPDLHDAAGEAFGSWDAALAEALQRAVQSTAHGGDADSRASITRSAGPEANHPIFAVTLDNTLVKIDPGDQLDIASELRDFDRPAGAEPVARFHHVGDPEGLVFFSDRGNYFALSPRMIPNWEGTDSIRRTANVLELEDGERLGALVSRRALYAGRIVHVTRGGKGKATDASDFEFAMDHESRIAFKLDDGDRPVDVMAVPEETGIFAASAHGRGIHFPDDELRSMGRRAVGVNVMDLEDETDAVVGAFPGERVDQVAVLTEQGLGKRVDFAEFRQQGRAGAGMQLARLDRDDAVASVAPCHPSDDLVVTTSEGRVQRRPAGDFDAMGRPAKGNRVVQLAEDEEILDLDSLPCSG